MSKIAVFGASGFVGRSCVGALESAGHDVVGCRAPRLSAAGNELARDPDQVLDGPTINRVGEALAGCDVVLNAAGMAIATSAARMDLFGANAAWPYLLAHACRVGGVRRLVHVSSAAVQGRAAVLDASDRCAPVSPYGESKALGERLLSRVATQEGLEVVIYRPPSVHGEGRDLSRSFAAFARRWPLVVSGTGDQPVPVALVGNVGAAAAALVEGDAPPPVVSHPYEGLTVRSLYEVFAPGRRVWSLPDAPVRAALRAIEIVGRYRPRVAALGRRAELLLLGQAQATSWLDERGFTPPLGAADWAVLARSV